VLIKDQPEINRNAIIEGATPGVIKVRLNLQLDHHSRRFVCFRPRVPKNPYISATVTESQTHYLRRNADAGC